MKCKRCGNEMREGSEQVGLNNGIAIYNRFAYCDNCREKVNLDALAQSNQPKKNSTLSIWACVLAIFTCTSPIAFILALVDLCRNDKNKKHIGSVFAIVVFVIYCFIIMSAFGSNTEEKTPQVSHSESQGEENEITVGSSFTSNGLKIIINDAKVDYKDYDDSYGAKEPKSGMKYVMVSFTFENNGDSDAYASIYDFTCYADDTTCEQVYILDDSDFMNTNLSPGRNVSFKTYYAVPINSQSIELEYETDAWTGGKAVIRIQ